MGFVSCHSDVQLLLLFFPISHCFLVFSLHISSSSAFLRPLFKQSCHELWSSSFSSIYCLCVSHLLGNISYFILTICPTHFTQFLTILPTAQDLFRISSLRSFIRRLTIPFTPSILIIQLFSHNCSLCCCSSDRDEVSQP